ncbi:RDD family protein [Nocardioides sp. YIM 152315]|uniref:RDD family protein n=1 Tax=Nocardioides sp. YIM 152315 TaxID=3031760 RepID=UPI0023D98A7C|nr:RDD family protein [Nocardioides sp. YIM 152315]MDF1604803.1 RDD family protein [Nocardioides sp. YIM 152315]
MPAPEFATLTTDDLVTGEAVALDLPPASLGARITSGLIDVVATSALLVALVLGLTIAALQADEALAAVAMLAAIIVSVVVFPTAIETLTRGRSLGKLAMGLRAVRDDAGPISFHHAFVRALVGVVEIYAFLGSPAFFCALLSPRGKRLGDYAAGTYVVRDRVRLTLAPPVPMPPALAAWAAGADMTALPTGLAMAVRQYLGRSHQIEPHARADLGERLATAVGRHVSPPPPSGTPPEAYLAAVVAERRDRDARRLAREADLRRRLASR